MQFPRGKAEYFTAVVRWWSLMNPLTRLYGKWDQKSQSRPSRDCRMNIWNCFDSKSFGSSFCWWFPSRNEWHDRHNEQKLDGINYAASVEIQTWRRRSLCIWISALASQARVAFNLQEIPSSIKYAQHESRLGGWHNTSSSKDADTDHQVWILSGAPFSISFFYLWTCLWRGGGANN